MEAERQELIRVLPGAQVAGLIEMSDNEFARMKGIATALAQAGVFKDASQPAVAFAKMVIGRELGLGLGQSMLGLHLVPGGVQMHYSTMLACVRARGWKYRITEHTEQLCTIEWVDSDGELVGSTTYTMEDAEKANLTKRSDRRPNEPSMYEKVPKNMLLARAVSNGVKAYVPEALGGMPLYVTGELPTQQTAVDGSVAGEDAPAETRSLSEVMAEVPPDLRDQMYAAYTDAADLRPGVVTPATVEMSVRGQPQSRVEAFIATVEKANEVARARREQHPPDAEVVPDADPPAEEPDLPAVDRDALEALRRRLSDLEDRRAAAEDDPIALEVLDAEAVQVEEEIAALGGALPGQESLL